MPKRVRLQDELRQSVPFRSGAQEAAVALLRTADRVRRRLVAVVAPHGITLQQYNVLRILAGADPESLPTLEIRDRMIEDAPAITGLLDRLQKKGLVRRSRSRSDRRQVDCRITPAGVALLAELNPRVDAADEAVVGRLAPARLRRLIALLEEVRGGG